MSAARTIDHRLLVWFAGLGAACEQAAAVRFGISERTARARLRALSRSGLLSELRILVGEPPLYAITRAGLRAAGASEFQAPRLSVSNAAHQAQLARVAAALAVALHETYTVHGERELRRWEHSAGELVASADVGVDARGAAAVHRPDVVCLPRGGGLPLVVEVELTCKAPQRLRRIVRGWARSRLVSHVAYYAAPGVDRAVRRAVALELAEQRVSVLPLDAAGTLASPTSSIPSAA
jgi:hypothetical protein